MTTAFPRPTGFMLKASRMNKVPQLNYQKQITDRKQAFKSVGGFETIPRLTALIPHGAAARSVGARSKDNQGG
jgi:hypothetical protein